MVLSVNLKDYPTINKFWYLIQPAHDQLGDWVLWGGNLKFNIQIITQ